MNNASPPLNVHDLTVAYQRQPVLWNVDYAAPAARLVAIVGPNGAGKSTLIKALLELIPRATGEVQFFGQSYAEIRQTIARELERYDADDRTRWDFAPVAELYRCPADTSSAPDSLSVNLMR